MHIKKKARKKNRDRQFERGRRDEGGEGTTGMRREKEWGRSVGKGLPSDRHDLHRVQGAPPFVVVAVI
jgi:hypothetical protein